MDKEDLPKHILEKAFISKSNELAWKKEDISDAIDAIMDLGGDISGGDVWIIKNNTRMEIPGFSSSVQEDNESFEDYKRKIKDEFLKWIEIMEEDSIEAMKDKQYVFYLVTF